MLSLKEIKEIISLVDESSLTEFKFKTEQGELSLKKEEQLVTTAPAAIVQAPQVQQTAPAVEAPAAPVATQPQETAGTAIKSPMVGTFYSASSPDVPDFVKVGDRVSKGQVVCIIEAMKLFNEIKSDVSGEVVEILAESGQLVEFDQPLFKIKED